MRLSLNQEQRTDSMMSINMGTQKQEAMLSSDSHSFMGEHKPWYTKNWMKR